MTTRAATTTMPPDTARRGTVRLGTGGPEVHRIGLGCMGTSGTVRLGTGGPEVHRIGL